MANVYLVRKVKVNKERDANEIWKWIYETVINLEVIKWFLIIKGGGKKPMFLL